MEFTPAKPYRAVFDASNNNWHPDGTFNLLFLKAAENHANHMLQARGHVFLNDVHDLLRLERTFDGQLVGWFHGGDGDNFVWFDAVMSEDQSSLTLQFNVDGVIADKLPREHSQKPSVQEERRPMTSFEEDFGHNPELARRIIGDPYKAPEQVQQAQEFLDTLVD